LCNDNTYGHTSITKNLRFSVAEIKDATLARFVNSINNVVWAASSKADDKALSNANDSRKSVLNAIPYIKRSKENGNRETASAGETLMEKYLKMREAGLIN
jgi:hypothetical protein